jgi:hypothetical protein
MNKLRLSIAKQKEKYEELSQTNDFFTIHDPIYDTINMNIICRNDLQKQTKMVAEHFYNVEYLTKIYEENYRELKIKLIWIIILLSILIIIFLSVIIVTFSYLENKSLSLIPLFSLIILTIIFSLFLINFLRLKLIDKIIDGRYKLDKKLIFLMLYKLKKEELEDMNFEINTNPSIMETCIGVGNISNNNNFIAYSNFNFDCNANNNNNNNTNRNIFINNGNGNLNLNENNFFNNNNIDDEEILKLKEENNNNNNNSNCGFNSSKFN